MMKPSIFNHFLEVDDHAILAYNSFSTALVRLEKDEFEWFQAFLGNSNQRLLQDQKMAAFKNQLVQTGLLVPHDMDELKTLQTMRLQYKSDQHHLGLTIIPTLNCNFKCSYCFSYANKKKMSPPVQQSVLTFIEQDLKTSKALTISWFGGEPTLCLDIIESLSCRVEKLCNTYQVKQNPGSIVTNGYRLTRNTAIKLNNLGITRAQITLDGDSKIHNQRRRLHNGRGTFDRILNNIIETCDLLKIQIRINIDHDNAPQAVGLLDTLASHHLEGKVAVYFGHVQPYTDACADVATSCLSDIEFSHLNLELTKAALIRGFNAFTYPESQINGVCGADRKNSYVVSPDGLLFKCWAEASMGEAWSVGNVRTPISTPLQQENLEKYSSWDPLSDENCCKCRILPICMGGCPHNRIHQPHQSDCAAWRYNLLDTLAIRYKLHTLTMLPEGNQPEPITDALSNIPPEP